jgi:hypothetical protein
LILKYFITRGRDCNGVDLVREGTEFRVFDRVSGIPGTGRDY